MSSFMNIIMSAVKTDCTAVVTQPWQTTHETKGHNIYKQGHNTTEMYQGKYCFLYDQTPVIIHMTYSRGRLFIQKGDKKHP